MNDVDEVKSRLDITQVIGKIVTLKKAGRNLKGLCPFHSEKTPSFMVSPDRQTFHCFGCGKGGSVIDFVMEYEHLDFREALEELAEQAGVTLTRKVMVTPEEKRKDKLLEIHHLAQEYYHFLLTKHDVGKNAREYITKRGVSEKIIESFGLGYSPASWDGLAKFLKKKGYDTNLLIESGLVIASNMGGYDRFRGRLMFPLRDHRGQVVAFSGRLLDASAKDLPESAAQNALQAGAKYINSPETPLYIKGNNLFALDITKAAIQKSGEAIIMEGEFDVISSYQAGISNVVAIKGSALTEAQVALLKRFARKILFALDSDIAGDAAARRGIEIADRAGLEIHVVSLPFGKDPDDVARTEPHLLKKAVEEALTIYDYYLTSSLKRFDVALPYGKKHISEEMIPVITRIENSVVQSHYVKKLANTLSLPENVVVDSIRKQAKRGVETTLLTEESKKDTIPAEDKYELYLLSLLLQGNTTELMEDVTEELDTKSLSSPAVAQVIDKLKIATQETTHFFLKDFLDSIPPELSPVVDWALLLDMSGVTDNPETLARTWNRTIHEVKKKSFKLTIQELTRSLSTATEEETIQINERISELARSLRSLEKQIEA